MTEKRFKIEFDTVRYFCVIDTSKGEHGLIARLDTMTDAKAVVELCEIYEGLR